VGARAFLHAVKAIDDVGNAFFNTPQDNFNILADKGPSDNDRRHRLVVNGTRRRSSEAIRRARGHTVRGRLLMPARRRSTS
jgi:hypothetical protein